MPEPIILERLEMIVEHVNVINERMVSIGVAQDFVSSPDGQILYDSILTRLQSIGENMKKIEKLAPGFIEEQLKLDGTKIIRFRDILSHHYELMDQDIIYNICKTNIPELDAAIANYFSKK
ncbi:MAG: DUF86 domain-containing protein [Chitinophagaceae bacterium]|nr:DUF86 domain-containing protein [Chitinophagaceae bacterium]MBN8668679.1 DUF86 domain-containing protein [Chitinophagales bacterium]